MVSTAERIAIYRSRMHDAGMREIRIWVPDERTESFARRAHNASVVLANADQQDDGLREFLLSNTDDLLKQLDATEGAYQW